MNFKQPPADESMVWFHRAVVERVVDGDTLVCTLDRGFNEYRIKSYVRLAGINTPESSTDEGKAATKFVETLLPRGTQVMLYTHKDKSGVYGRLIAEVMINNINVNKTLVDQGYADLY